MKELFKIAKAAKEVNSVKYTDLSQNDAVGLRLVIPAIQADVKTLDERA